VSSYSFTHFDGRHVTVDRRNQLLHAEIEEQGASGERPPKGAAQKGPSGIGLFTDGTTWQARSYPSVARTPFSRHFTPLLAMAAKAKAFDDRLMAAVERISHNGHGDQPGLFAVIEAASQLLQPGTHGRALLDAANAIHTGEYPAEPEPQALARKVIDDFAADRKASKSVGIYAEDRELHAIFLFDRLLQQKLDAKTCRELAAALIGSGVESGLRHQLQLAATLSNPLSRPSVLNQGNELLPPSDSLEAGLIRKLFSGSSIPAGFSLCDELINRLLDGRMSSVPKPDDGWYAHQFHANAALLEPDTAGLTVGPRYRTFLRELFEALFAITRETHIKQLEAAMGGGMPLIISPRITIEPVPAYYQRIASAYAFLHDGLLRTLGADTLASTEMADGTALGEGINQMQSLFVGAHAVCQQELGQPTVDDPGQAAGIETFKSWQQTSESDPDLRTDLRIAVPLFFDVEKQTTRLCVTLGIEVKTLNIEFERKPTVEVSGDSKFPWAGAPIFTTSSHPVLVPVTVEVDVRVPPTRKELRSLCTRNPDRAALVAALELL